jgi:hypothetical protein
MSYIFLLEQGEESSAECFSDIPACALSNGTSTLDNACLPDSGTDACHASQSGTTCKPSMETLGADELMSSAEGSPAKTSAQPEKARESTDRAAECGHTWPESFARWDHATSSWKTHQCSLFGGLETFSETWPRWGMMRDGECWELMMQEPATNGSASGYWPTPRACNPGSRPNGKGGKVLAEEVAIAEGMKQRGESGSAAGLISPEWVELLMGWPLGWTDCAASATDRFQAWRHSHSKCFPLVLKEGNK